MTAMDGAAYPAAWPERIRALARGELDPVTPREAATVLLLGDADLAVRPGLGDADLAARPGLSDADLAVRPEPSDGDPQGARDRAESPALTVHMLRRRPSMAFAGGAYAYPGGGVDPRDERPVRWAGPGLAQWAATLGVPERRAQAVVCAAVRETFEESGVLLAGPADADGAAPGGTVVADTTGPGWEADRRALVRHDLGFADFLARRDLVLRSDLLAPWARWITPEFEERRYDTWFFLARLPQGQRTLEVTGDGEADRTVWLRPADAVAGYERGEMVMLPPTVTMLRDLLPYRTADEALAAAPGRDLTPVVPYATVDEEAGSVVLSWPRHGHFDRVVMEGGAGR